MESVFPDFYPSNILELILADGAEANSIEVFRICRNGFVNRDAFVSTAQDPFRNIKNKQLVNRDFILQDNEDVDIGVYSTSCFESIKDVNRIFGAMVKTTPKQIVAKGITEPSCGLSLRTKMSKSHRKTTGSHVDWWLYKDASPEMYFQEYEIEKERTR